MTPFVTLETTNLVKIQSHPTILITELVNHTAYIWEVQEHTSVNGSNVVVVVV